jgi:hypothetical protein
MCEKERERERERAASIVSANENAVAKMYRERSNLLFFDRLSAEERRPPEEERGKRNAG